MNVVPKSYACKHFALCICTSAVPGPLKSWAGADIYRPRPHDFMGRPSPAPLVFQPAPGLCVPALKK